MLPIIEKNDDVFSLKTEDGKIFDFSSLAPTLGREFISRACAAVKSKDNREERNARSWKDYYVIPFQYLLENLVAQVDGLGQSNFDGQWDESHWVDFTASLRLSIDSQWTAKLTRSKKVAEINSVLIILFQSGIISMRCEVQPKKPRKFERVRKSVISKRKLNLIKRENITAFECEFGFQSADGATYDFSAYSSLLPAFLKVAIPALKLEFARLKKNTRKNRYGALNSFFRFLVKLKKQRIHTSFFQRLSSADYILIADIEWEVVITEWQENVTDGSKKLEPISAMQSLGMVANTLDLFSDHGIIPRLSLGMLRRKKKIVQVRRKNLVQAMSTANISPLVKSIFSRMKKFFFGTDQREVLQHINALVTVGNLVDEDSCNLDILANKIHELNHQVLLRMREAAEADFMKWRKHWQFGQELLAAVTAENKNKIEALHSPNLSDSQIRNLSGSLFFRGEFETTLANSLHYVMATQDGIAEGLGGRYSKIVTQHGGMEIFQAYLHPHPEATACLWVLMLIDSGANTEVAREIERAGISPSEDGRYVIQFADKARAGGKAIRDEFHLKPTDGQLLSLPQAIIYYKEMATQLYELAGPQFSKLMLLRISAGDAVGITGAKARDWFKAFVSRHTSLRSIDATPSMIRPSVLLHTQSSHGGRVEAAQALADHASSNTTMGYTGKISQLLQYNLKVLEFINRLEAAITASIDGAAEKLGIPQEEFQRRHADAMRTGLGIFCSNPFAGTQPGTSSNEPCHRQDNCWGCQQKVVVGSVENIVDLLLFNKHLNAQQDAKMATNADRWIEKWLPWLVFSNIALSKLKLGETAAKFAEASLIAEARYPTYCTIPLE